MKTKSEIYIHRILKLLLENDILRISDIAKTIKLSDKTIRNYIKQLNVMLKDNELGEIETKQGVGIRLVATNMQKTKLTTSIKEMMIPAHIESSEARMYDVLKLLFMSGKNQRVTSQSISEMMYLSLPTTMKVLDDAKAWLLQFGIELVTSRNEGLLLVSEELNYRLACKHLIIDLSQYYAIDMVLKELLFGVNLPLIKEIIIKSERERKIDFAEESFYDCFIFTCMAIQRYLKGHLVKVNEAELKTLESYSEYGFAASIFDKFSSYSHIDIPEEEIGFLSIQILCAKVIETEYVYDTKQLLNEFNNKIDDYVHKLIIVLSNVLDINLTEDLDLKKGLVMHLKSCIFRLKYERSNHDRLTKFIKNEYQQTFRISWVVSVLFEEYFSLKITEAELSYIVLYIQSALERNRKPIIATLVTSNGMGVNHFLCDRIQRKFPEIKDIEIMSTHDYSSSKAIHKKLILSTSDIKDTNVVIIDDFLSEASIQLISEKLDELDKDKAKEEVKFDVLCHQLFEPDLIFCNLEVKSKEELIKRMCQRLLQKGYVIEGFYNSVIEREQANSTSIGNSCATPHGDQQYINDSRICIATLQQEIPWDEEYVSVVFLMVVKTNNPTEITKTQLFCIQYLNLVETMEQVNELKRFETSEEFYKYLVR